MSKNKEFRKSDFVSNIRFFNYAIAVQICLTFLALIHAWTLQYKSEISPDGFVNRISYISSDKPWMPSGTDADPLLHLHYFGDWVLNVAYGGVPRPYDPNLQIPAQFAPIGILFFSIIYIIGYKIGYLLILIGTAYLWWRIVRKLFPQEDILKQIVILFFSVFLTAPAIIAFDRGGTQLFVLGLLGNALINLKSQSWKLAFAQYLLAVSMKPYLLFLLLALLMDERISLIKRFFNVIKVALGIFLINVICLPLFADNLVQGLGDQFAAISRFAGDWGIPWIMDGASLTSFVSKTFEFFHGNLEAVNFMSDFIPFWPRVLALIYLAFILICITGKILTQSQKIFLILSTVSLLSPFSGPYTIVWLSLAFLFVVHEFTYIRDLSTMNVVEKTILGSMLLTCYIGLTPYFGFFPMHSGATRHNPGNYFYIFPILFIVTISTLRELKLIFQISNKI